MSTSLGLIEDVLREIVRSEVRTVLREELAAMGEQPAGPSPPGDFLSSGEAAKLAGVNADTVRRWIASGALRGYRAGRLWRVAREDLLAFVASSSSNGRAVVEDRAKKIVRDVLMTSQLSDDATRMD